MAWFHVIRPSCWSKVKSVVIHHQLGAKDVVKGCLVRKILGQEWCHDSSSFYLSTQTADWIPQNEAKIIMYLTSLWVGEGRSWNWESHNATQFRQSSCTELHEKLYSLCNVYVRKWCSRWKRWHKVLWTVTEWVGTPPVKDWHLLKWGNYPVVRHCILWAQSLESTLVSGMPWHRLGTSLGNTMIVQHNCLQPYFWSWSYMTAVRTCIELIVVAIAQIKYLHVWGCTRYEMWSLTKSKGN